MPRASLVRLSSTSCTALARLDSHWLTAVVHVAQTCDCMRSSVLWQGAYRVRGFCFPASDYNPMRTMQKSWPTEDGQWRLQWIKVEADRVTESWTWVGEQPELAAKDEELGTKERGQGAWMSLLFFV